MPSPMRFSTTFPYFLPSSCRNTGKAPLSSSKRFYADFTVLSDFNRRCAYFSFLFDTAVKSGKPSPTGAVHLPAQVIFPKILDVRSGTEVLSDWRMNITQTCYQRQPVVVMPIICPQKFQFPLFHARFVAQDKNLVLHGVDDSLILDAFDAVRSSFLTTGRSCPVAAVLQGSSVICIPSNA